MRNRFTDHVSSVRFCDLMRAFLCKERYSFVIEFFGHSSPLICIYGAETDQFSDRTFCIKGHELLSLPAQSTSSKPAQVCMTS